MMTATTEPAAAQKKKPFITGKRLLVAAFAVAVGALALDDLALRVENYAQGAVIEQLLEENEALRQNQDEEKGGGEFMIIPQQKDRILEVSTRAPKPLTTAI